MGARGHESLNGASWFTGTRRQVSTTFDDRQTAGSRRLCAAVARSLAPHAEHILDIGCGGGEVLELACSLWPDGQLVGIDPEPDAVAAASKRLHGTGASLLVASAETLDRSLPADAAFDLILCHLNFALWDSPVDGLTQALSRLRPGGTLYLVDLARPTDQEHTELLRLAADDAEREYLAVQAQTSMTLDDAEETLRRAAAECPHQLRVRLGRGGLAGHRFDSPEAAELWSDAAVRDAVASMAPADGGAPSADPVLHLEVRRDA